MIWTGQQRAREFFYATPTVAYGRVYIGSTDGTMYVYGAKSGKLLWARPLGSYIYGAAAVYKRKVFVGTYDGKFYALDAATGDVRWQIDAQGAVHAAPTVMTGSSTTRSARAAARKRSAPWPAGGTPPMRCERATAGGVDLPGRQVREPGGGRQGAHLPHRAGPPVCVRGKGSQVVKDYLRQDRQRRRRAESR